MLQLFSVCGVALDVAMWFNTACRWSIDGVIYCNIYLGSDSCTGDEKYLEKYTLCLYESYRL